MDERKTSAFKGQGRVYRYVECLRCLVGFYHIITNSPFFRRRSYVSAKLLRHPHKLFSGMSPPVGA